MDCLNFSDDTDGAVLRAPQPQYASCPDASSGIITAAIIRTDLMQRRIRKLSSDEKKSRHLILRILRQKDQVFAKISSTV